MTSGYISENGEPGLDQILQALRAAVKENPRLSEMPTEEVARQLVLGGHLQEEPTTPLVAEALRSLEVEGQTFQTDEIPSEEGNPT